MLWLGLPILGLLMLLEKQNVQLTCLVLLVGLSHMFAVNIVVYVVVVYIDWIIIVLGSIIVWALLIKGSLLCSYGAYALIW